MSTTDRWLSLSSVLWSLLFEEVQVQLDNKAEEGDDQDAFLSFLDLLEWRRDARVTPQEFTILYKEWNGSQCGFITLDRFRELLRVHGRHYNEANLNLFVAFLLHENRSIVMSSTSLPSQWVELTEDAFFSLDVRGHGRLGWDEVYFFSACVILGTNTLLSGSDALSVVSITAVAAQLTRDLQGGVAPRLHMQEPSDMRISAVTAPKFLRLMLSKEVSTSELQALACHLKRCADVLARMLHSSTNGNFNSHPRLDDGYEELLKASLVRCDGGVGSAEGNNGWAVGPPCLWRRAVVTATGCTDANVSAIALFLLSSADSVLSVMIRGYPHSISQRKTPVSLPLMSRDDGDREKGRWSIEDETHAVVLHLWTLYQQWKQQQYRPSQKPQAQTVALQDPEYALVLSAVVEYKRLQLALSTALESISQHLSRSRVAPEVVEACRAVLPPDAHVVVDRMERLLCQQQTALVRQATRSPQRLHPRRQSPVSDPPSHAEWDESATRSDEFRTGGGDSVQLRRSELVKQLLDAEDADDQRRLVAALRSLAPDEPLPSNTHSSSSPRQRSTHVHVHVHVPSSDASPSSLPAKTGFAAVVAATAGAAAGSETDHIDRLAALPPPPHTAPSRALAFAPASALRAGGGDRVRWEDPVQQQPSVAASLDSVASLTELLGRESKVAQYAETLKDILKQMPSSTDSKDQFKSLQKVC